MVKSVTILGATGSIGQQTLAVLRRHPDRFHVSALTGGKNIAALAAAAREFRPDVIAVADAAGYGELKTLLPDLPIEILVGDDGVTAAAARPADITVAAIVGMAGLAPTMAAIARGGRLALANKESLVCAGDIMLAAARRAGTEILPVDSEHNAIFQVFENHNRAAVRELILTASGGPFRTWAAADIRAATRAQALRHPNWTMGEKITIDSASLMNKALEWIEAHYLFAMPTEQIRIVVHPQSIIHSMVAYHDGSILAQMGPPDMTVPIAYALGFPERLTTGAAALDFAALGQLTFEAPDEARFPALRLAREAQAAGPAMVTAMNAANEVAVAAFLADKIPFGRLAELIDAVLQRAHNAPLESLADVVAADAAARRLTQELI